MIASGVSSASGQPTQRAGTASNQPETAAHKKLAKAAQEFEGLLIAQLLGNFTSGMSSFSGEAPLAGSDSLNTLAVQALSTAMAGRGGFGIGKMLVHQLEPTVSHEK